ncbi:MAG: DNA repair protein RecO, partial [Sulfitobacter sp.]|nr:DNA repair protein RecO [Sulfitobacter sp.]
MGFGLDLTRCAVLGSAANDLSFVSPRTGRAVSRKGAGEWADRLLPLPDVLRGQGEAPDAEIAQAFRTTGHFLNAHLARDLGDKPLPEARARYVDAFSRGL